LILSKDNDNNKGQIFIWDMPAVSTSWFCR